MKHFAQRIVFLRIMLMNMTYSEDSVFSKLFLNMLDWKNNFSYSLHEVLTMDSTSLGNVEMPADRGSCMFKCQTKYYLLLRAAS